MIEEQTFEQDGQDDGLPVLKKKPTSATPPTKSDGLPVLKKKEQSVLPSSTGGSSSPSIPSQAATPTTPEDPLELFKQRKKAKELLIDNRGYGMGASAPNKEDIDARNKAYEDINKRIEAAGYDQQFATDLQDLPEGEGFSFKENIPSLKKLRQENPSAYERAVSSMKWKGQLHNAIRKKNLKPVDESDKEAVKKAEQMATYAAQYNIQGLQHLEKENARGATKKAIQLIRENVDSEEEQQKLISELIKDKSYDYGIQPIQEDESLQHLNPYQRRAMQYLKDVDPATFESYSRLLSSDPTQSWMGSKESDIRRGYELKSRELEAMGMGLMSKAYEERLSDLNTKAAEGQMTPEEKVKYDRLLEHIDVFDEQIRATQLSDKDRAEYTNLDKLRVEYETRAKTEQLPRFEMGRYERIIDRMNEIAGSVPKSIYEERNKAVKEINELVNKYKGKGLSDGEAKEFQKLYDEYSTLSEDKKSQGSRYPTIAKMDTERVLQESMGANNSVAKKFALGVGENFDDAVNWVGGLIEDKGITGDLELMGDKEFSSSVQRYDTEKQKLIGSDTVVEFSKDLQKKIDAVKADKSLTDDEKRGSVRQLISENSNEIGYRPNDAAGKTNFTAKAVLSTTANIASDLVSQLAIASMTGGAGNASKLKQLSSLFGTTYATAYNDNYNQALRNNVPNPTQYAIIHTTIEAASELINNDFAMVKKLVGGKGTLGKLLSNVTQKQWDEIATKGTFSKIKDAALSAGKKSFSNAFQETSEEVAGQLGTNLADQQMFGKDMGLGDGVRDTMISTFVGMLPLGLLSLPFNYKNINRNQKYALYEAGMNPQKFIESINADLRSGAISQQEADQRLKNVEAAVKAVEASGGIRPDGKPMTDNEKTEFAFNQMVLQQIKEQKKNAPSEVKEKLEKEEEKLDKENSEILTKPRKRVVVGKPDEATPQSVIEKAISEGKIADNLQEFAKKNPEQFFKDIAEQAQGEMEFEGKTVSTREQTETQFGKEIVDKAIEMFPKQADMKPLYFSAEAEAEVANLNITKDGKEFLKSLYDSGVPAFVTKNLKRIAKENGIEVTGNTTPDDIIDQLRAKKNENIPEATVPDQQGNIQAEEVSQPVQATTEVVEDAKEEVETGGGFRVGKIKAPSIMVNTEIADSWVRGAIRAESDKNDARLDQLAELLVRSLSSDSDIKMGLEAIERFREKLKRSQPKIEREEDFASELDRALSQGLDKMGGEQQAAKASTDEYLQKAKTVLSKLFPNVTVTVYETSKEYQEKEGRPVGSKGVFHPDQNRIAFNMEAIRATNDPATIFHEVIHPIVRAAMAKSDTALDSLYEGLESMKDEPGMAEVWDHMNQYYSRGGKIQKEEAVTEFFTMVADGRMDTEKLSQGTISKIIDWVNKFFETIGLPTRINNVGDLKKMADSIKEALQTGNVESLSKTLGEKPTTSTGESLDSLSGDKQKEAIKELIKRAESIPTERLAQIISQKAGITEQEATDLINSVRKPRVRVPAEKMEEAAKGKSTEPTKKEPVEQSGKEPINNPKAILNAINESENIPQSVKDKFAKHGLTYDPQSHEEARSIAKDIIDRFGVDNSISMAESGRFDGDVNSMIFAEGIDRTFLEEQEASNQADKIAAAERWADYALRYDEAARQKGRFISAIYDFYKRSPLGIMIAERKKRQEAFSDWFKRRDKPFKEVFESLKNEPEFKEMLKWAGAVKSEGDARKRRREKISNFFDKAKIGRKGMNVSIVPPVIWDGAVEVMKQAFLAGESIAAVIEKGIKHIRDNHKDSWDEEAFRNEWQTQLEKLSAENAELKKEAQDKFLNKFRKKMSGMTDEQKADVIRKSAKKLIENGALEYDDFKKIIAETMGYGDLSAEEVASIQELVNDMNAVQDAADNVMAQKGDADIRKAIKEYDDVAKKAEKSATKLAGMLYNKPDLGQRVRSVIQLNTLGLVSLIKNPFYNIFHQFFVRLPKGIILTTVDQMIYGASVLGNRLFGSPVVKPDTNILLAQKGYFTKASEGGKQSIEQVFTGLTNRDYFQKEVHASQIKPFQSWRDIWNWGKGEKNLSKSQLWDKIIQGTVGVPAEMVARMLNIGDKPFRYAAEGAIAETIATQEFKLSGAEKERFVHFPKEVAKSIYKSRGLSEEDANEKAEKIEKRIVSEGEEAVFQQENWLSEKLTKLKQQKLDDDANPLAKFGEQAGRLIGVLNMPFVKTPLNVGWEVINLVNPELALLQSAVYGWKAIRDGSHADYVKAKKWMAHAATGWALLSAIGYIASIGAVSGDDEDEPYKAKESKGKATYEKAKRVNVSKLNRVLAGGTSNTEDGDVMIDLSWFGAIGMIMNMQANKYENMSAAEREQMGYIDDLAYRMKSGAAEGLTNSVFQGALTAVEAIRSPENKGGAWLNGMLNVGMNFFEPATIAQLSRATREHEYTIKGDSLSETLKNNLKSRFFGSVPPKVNIWGEVMKKGNPIMGMLGINEFDNEAFGVRLFNEFKRTGDANFFPPAIMPEINGHKLNKEMATKMETLIGQSRKALVAPFISSAGSMKVVENGFVVEKKYDDLTDEQKLKRLKKLYEQGAAIGKRQFATLYPQYGKKAKD